MSATGPSAAAWQTTSGRRASTAFLLLLSVLLVLPSADYPVPANPP